MRLSPIVFSLFVASSLTACFRSSDVTSLFTTEAVATPTEAPSQQDQVALPPQTTDDVTSIPQPPQRVRIIASNLTSGNKQSYDPGHGARILKALKGNIVAMQEFNYKDNLPETIMGWVKEVFGKDFVYTRENDSQAQIPNGVVTSFPIVRQGEWDDPYVINRDFVWAELDVPGPKNMLVVSVHILTKSADVRQKEAVELVKYIKSYNAQANNYVVIAGDLNTKNDKEPCFDVFEEIVSTKAPFPADEQGKVGTNAARRYQYDWVLLDPALRALQVPTKIGGKEFAAGLVFDTRDYEPLTDLADVSREDSQASGMQHMAVVKDLMLQD